MSNSRTVLLLAWCFCYTTIPPTESLIVHNHHTARQPLLACRRRLQALLAVLTSHGCMHFANSYVCHGICISLARLPLFSIRVRGRPVTSPASYRGIRRNQQCSSSVWHIMCISIAHTKSSLRRRGALDAKTTAAWRKEEKSYSTYTGLVVWVLCYCLQSPRTGITHIYMYTNNERPALRLKHIHHYLMVGRLFRRHVEQWRR